MDNLTANSAATENQARSVQGGSLTFDALQRPIPLHFILSTRSGRHIREIPADNVRFHDTLMNGSEVSFLVYKEKCIDENGEIDTRFWNKIKDLKLIYCKDLDMFYELRVNLTDSDDVVKSVTALSLGEAETSQCNVYGIEVNTEDDIARDDYSPCILYDSEHSDRSLIDRLFSKMQHYDVAHVDSTIARIQRTFQFDGQSIHDCCQEIEKEIGCLFKFECRKASGNKIRRTVSIYDMMSTCDACGARGEFSEVCESCGSTLIHRGYGKDTGIYISRDNLAESIEYEADTDSVKNCFRLNGGDELMNAAIIAQNPNGSQYIWYISDDMREDMSPALRDRLDAYDAQYDYYQKTFAPDIQNEVTDSTIRSMIDFYDSHYSIQIPAGDKYNLQERYNRIVDRYISYNEDLCKIMGDITGYPKIMEAYYNTIDLELFLRSGLMPNVGSSKTNAESEASKLTSRNLSPCAVADLSSCSKTTADNAVINMARCIVKPSFNVKINNSSYSAGEWRGSFTVSNYSDDEDTATTQNISVTINGDVERYIKQKIDTAISREREDATDILGLFSLDEREFRINLRKYCLKKLEGFRDSCQVSLDTMIQHGVTGTEVSGSTMAGVYENLYRPYRQKIAYIENEIKARDTELAIVTAIRDESGNVVTDGMQSAIEKNINRIHDGMNFENFVGQELMREFSSFRRDDVYENSNYISDGLDNRELFQRAAEFIDTAKREIARAARVHHKVTANLSDLFTMKEFQPIVKDFLVGNKLHIKIDDRLYTLRLSEYEIDYNTFELSNVVFSDVVDGASSAGDIGDILGKAKSISTSYNSVKRQASAGKKSNDALQDIAEKGLRLTTHIVGGAHNQEFLLDESGYLGRTYIPETDSYSPEQIKIISNGLYVTNDAWETMKAALGKFQYYNPKTDKIETGFGVIAEQLVGGMLLSEEAGIYNENGSVVIDENGINMIVDSEGNTTAFKIQRRDKDGDLKNIFNIDASGNLVIDGSMEATTGYIGSKEWGFTITENSIYNGVTHFDDTAHDGVYIGTDGIVLGKGVFKVNKSGKVDASNLSITGGDITIKKGNKVTFSVTNDGTVTASDLWITGGDINIRDPETGKYFKVDPKGSVEASSMNIFGGSIAIGGSNGIPAFYVTSTGSATVSNLTITGGAISLGTAVNGGLPPFYVDNDGDAIVRSLSLNGGSISLGGTLSNPMFYANNDGAVTARNLTLTGGSIKISKNNFSIFSVSSNGNLEANFAGGTLTIGDKFKYITDQNGNGTLTAGGFTIDDNAIYSNGLNTWQSTRKRAATKGAEDVVRGVYIGPDGIRLGDKFRVDAEGNLYASSGTFENEVWASNIKWGFDENTGIDYGVLSGGAIGGDGTLNGAVVTDNTLPGGAIALYSLTGDRIGYGQISGGIDSNGNATGQLANGVVNSLGYANAYNSAIQNGTTTYPTYFTVGNLYVRGGQILNEGDYLIKVTTSGSSRVYNLQAHTHQISADSNGVVTIGAADWTGADHFFNIADTQYFKDAVSAAQSGNITGITHTTATNVFFNSSTKNISGDFTVYVKNGNTTLAEFESQQFIIPASSAYNTGVDDAEANYITFNPSSPAGYLNGLIASTDGYKTSGNNKYVQAIFNITAGHQINGSTDTAYDFPSNNRIFNVDITDIYNEAYNAGVTSGGGGNITSLTIQSARNYSGTQIVDRSSSRASSFNTNTFTATANLLVNGSSIGDLSVDITGITEDLYLYGFQPTINSFDSSNNRLYIRSNYELRLRQDDGGSQKIIDYYDGSTNNYVDISSYISGGSGVSINDVIISASNQASYSTSADASVSFDYDYVRYNSDSKELRGRANVTLSDGSNTTTKTLFIAMDANKVIEAEGGSSIIDATRVQSVEPTSYSASAYDELLTFSNTNQLRYVNGYLQGRAIITLSNNETTRLLIKMDGDLASGSSVDRTITSSSYPNNDYTRLTVDFTTGSSQEIDLPYVGNKTLYQYAYDLGYNASPGDSSSSVTVSDITSTYNSGEWDYSVEISRNKTSYSNGYLYGYVNVTLSNDRAYTVQVEMNASKASSSSSVTITHTASLYVQYMGIHRISGVNFYQHAVTPYSNVNGEYEVAGNTFYVDLTYQAEDGFYGNQSQTITL